MGTAHPRPAPQAINASSTPASGSTRSLSIAPALILSLESIAPLLLFLETSSSFGLSERQHPEIDASETEVRVQDGELTSPARLMSGSTRRMAEDIAENVSGVTDVWNEIRVQKDSSGKHNEGGLGWAAARPR